MMTIQCGCGASELTVMRPPRMRIICHCTICQRFNDAPFGDVTIMKREEAVLTDESTVSFQRYKSPPAVDRGRCASCDEPFVEYLQLPLLADLAFIPASVLALHMDLEEPSMHVFYETRQDDVRDELPHHRGFLASQWAMTRKLLPALRGT